MENLKKKKKKYKKLHYNAPVDLHTTIYNTGVMIPVAWILTCSSSSLDHLKFCYIESEAWESHTEQKNSRFGGWISVMLCLAFYLLI